MLKKDIACVLSISIMLSVVSTIVTNASDNSTFKQMLESKYQNIEIVNKSEVRWWIAQGFHTDETIKEQVQAIYDAGFRGIELCQLRDSDINSSIYGYGSDQWDHDLKLILNMALDLGMTVSLTSGAGWSSANVPGLNPDSQSANQCIIQAEETVKAGASRSGALARTSNIRSAASLIGVYAYRKNTATSITKNTLAGITSSIETDTSEFTIETDVIIDSQNTGFCFGGRNTNNFIMWQINTTNTKGKVLLCPHARINGTWSNTTYDITDIVGNDIIGKKLHMKIVVKDGKVYTYFNDNDTAVGPYSLPSNVALNSNGVFSPGKLYFRQQCEYKYSNNDVARYDNITVTDANGNTIYSNDFSSDTLDGFDDDPGLVLVDGMLRVGIIQQEGLGGDPVENELYLLQTRENDSDPENFTIEGDFTIEKENTSLCFGVRDQNNLIMWQIKTKTGNDNVNVAPLIRKNGSWGEGATFNVTDYIGYTASELINKKIHIKVQVKNGVASTYFNGSTQPAFEWTIPESVPKNSDGKFTLGKIAFRQKTSATYSNEEIALWDNLIVTDEDGTILFSEDFSDPNNTGFETKMGAEVVNGQLRVGTDQELDGSKVFTADEFYDLTDLVTNGTLSWTAPYDGDYIIRYYYQQGTAQASSPSVTSSYCINYFDSRGLDALKTYWLENVLNDSELNEKIKNGDVQLFMDSLEYTNGSGFTIWPEGFDKKFKEIKGYDVTPYMYLAIGAPTRSIWVWDNNSDLYGTYTLTDSKLATKILNDIYDVQTQLYMNEFMKPFKEWLNSYGITLRAQISYGKNLEISQPIQSVDYPEAENRNQRNQLDIYRVWSGGSKLQNKVLSSETGGLNNSAYTYTYQRQLQEAYIQYAAGYSRIIWHIWSADYGPKASWPGYESGSGYAGYYKLGTREPSYSDYDEFNMHLGRIQQLLREGKSGTDIGMLYTKYGQHLPYGTNSDWLKQHRTMLFGSTLLQDNGYTYDYFDSSFLTADGVYYDKENGTLELAGYKAIVLWQQQLALDGAKALLDYVKQGLKVVIVDGAATISPYNDDAEVELAKVIEEIKTYANVKTAASADQVIYALSELGVSPYAGFSEANQQLVTQVRRDGDNRYLYVYNYCDQSQHGSASKSHGDIISTQIVMDGIFIPYKIDSWTGKVTELASYYHQDGKTYFPITLEYGDVALYAFEATDTLYTASDKLSDNAYFENGNLYDKVLTGNTFDITDWSLTVESWTEGQTLSRSETVLGVNTTEYVKTTAKNNINVTLDTLTTWDNIEAVGKTVSGKGYYSASFNWDGTADGAYLDLGKLVQSAKVKINGEYTDSVNINSPRIDISRQLKIGKNKIEIIYSSNLTNVQLARGVITDGIVPNNFLGYDTTYMSYGISQATVIPYNLVWLNSPPATPVVDTNGYSSGEWSNSNVTLSVSSQANDKVRLEYCINGGEWQAYTEPIIVSIETAETVYTFKAVNEFGVSSEEKSVTVKLDKTAPSGDIVIEQNSVKSLSDNIAFSLFYNKDVNVEIKAEDSISDVKSIKYFRSEQAMTKQQVAEIIDWYEYDSTITEAAKDGKRFVYYVKITDNAGNETFFSSNGVLFDLTNPEISGVNNGQTYYTNQKIEVTDTNLESVTVNGDLVNAATTLDGNKETTYTIVAKDKAGNLATVKVEMKTIESLSEAIDGITLDNVTSADNNKIKQYIEVLYTMLEDENLIEDQKEIIENFKDNAQKLLDKINEASQAKNTKNIQQIKDVTFENVTMEDKNLLNNAKDDVEKAMADYADNYTDVETKQLEQTLNQIDKALEVIQKVENVEKSIGSLPETIGLSESETDRQVEVASQMYNALSEYEKSLVTDESVSKLKNLLTQLTQQTPSTSDENSLDSTSTLLTPDENIPYESTTPNTGDNINIALWLSIMMTSCAAVIGLAIYIRKKKYRQ